MSVRPSGLSPGSLRCGGLSAVVGETTCAGERMRPCHTPSSRCRKRSKYEAKQAAGPSGLGCDRSAPLDCFCPRRGRLSWRERVLQIRLRGATWRLRTRMSNALLTFFLPDHALAKEHAAVAAWIEEAVRGLSASQCEQPVGSQIEVSGKNALGRATRSNRGCMLKPRSSELLFWDDLAEKARGGGSGRNARRVPDPHSQVVRAYRAPNAKRRPSSRPSCGGAASPCNETTCSPLWNWCCRF